ncbi:lipoyl(octanoyl) transferase LipB [Chloroflexota bacterium]
MVVTQEMRSSNKRIYAADYLGVVPYESALKLQRELEQARDGDKIPDVLLLLQHPPVFTIGRFRGRENLIIPQEKLQREGIAVFETNRGGSITYHGPGQLVGYPILNLKKIGLGVREYIWKLEEVVIRLLLELGIRGHRVTKYPGVWVDSKKICSVGIHVNRHITTHGFALNVNTELRYFDYVRPCGINSAVITSISKLLGYPLEVEAIIEPVLNCFSAVFELRCQREGGKYLAALNTPSG